MEDHLVSGEKFFNEFLDHHADILDENPHLHHRMREHVLTYKRSRNTLFSLTRGDEALMMHAKKDAKKGG
jgi:hypothetical protein